MYNDVWGCAEILPIVQIYVTINGNNMYLLFLNQIVCHFIGDRVSAELHRRSDREKKMVPYTSG